MNQRCKCGHNLDKHETNMFGTQCRGTVRHDETVTPCHCDQFVADPEMEKFPEWVVRR